MKIADIRHHITNPNPLMIDIGAFDGRDSLDFLNEFPGGRAIAIEPLSYKLIPDHPRLDVLPVAITQFAGISWINICTNHPQSSSLLRPVEHLDFWPEYKFDEMKQVAGITGKMLFEGVQDVVNVDLVWIDVNGYEYDVVRSIKDILCQTKLVKIEVTENELYRGQGKSYDVIRAIRRVANFQIDMIEDCGLNSAFQNVLLINRDLL